MVYHKSDYIFFLKALCLLYISIVLEGVEVVNEMTSLANTYAVEDKRAPLLNALTMIK